MSNKTFSLKRKTQNITLEGDSGPVEYQLTEMSAARRDTYLQKLSGRVSTDAEGNPKGVNNFAGMQAELIEACLANIDGTRPTTEEIQEWPAGVVSGVYTLCQEMNGLTQDKDTEGASGNE